MAPGWRAAGGPLGLRSTTEAHAANSAREESAGACRAADAEALTTVGTTETTQGGDGRSRRRGAARPGRWPRVWGCDRNLSAWREELGKERRATPASTPDWPAPGASSSFLACTAWWGHPKARPPEPPGKPAAPGRCEGLPRVLQVSEDPRPSLAHPAAELVPILGRSGEIPPPAGSNRAPDQESPGHQPALPAPAPRPPACDFFMLPPPWPPLPGKVAAARRAPGQLIPGPSGRVGDGPPARSAWFRPTEVRVQPGPASPGRLEGARSALGPPHLGVSSQAPPRTRPI